MLPSCRDNVWQNLDLFLKKPFKDILRLTTPSSKAAKDSSSSLALLSKVLVLKRCMAAEIIKNNGPDILHFNHLAFVVIKIIENHQMIIFAKQV